MTEVYLVLYGASIVASVLLFAHRDLDRHQAPRRVRRARAPRAPTDDAAAPSCAVVLACGDRYAARGRGAAPPSHRRLIAPEESPPAARIAGDEQAHGWNSPVRQVFVFRGVPVFNPCQPAHQTSCPGRQVHARQQIGSRIGAFAGAGGVAGRRCAGRSPRAGVCRACGSRACSRGRSRRCSSAASPCTSITRASCRRCVNPARAASAASDGRRRSRIRRRGEKREFP